MTICLMRSEQHDTLQIIIDHYSIPTANPDEFMDMDLFSFHTGADLFLHLRHEGGWWSLICGEVSVFMYDQWTNILTNYQHINTTQINSISSFYFILPSQRKVMSKAERCWAIRGKSSDVFLKLCRLFILFISVSSVAAIHDRASWPPG